MRALGVVVLLGLVAYVVQSGSTLGATPQELPFERFTVDLTSAAQQDEFVVVRTTEELARMWQLHAKPATPGIEPQQPPGVDFGKRIMVAFFGGGSVCEPYRITRVLQYSTKTTVEITHRVMGETCTCITIFAPSIEVVSIPRVGEPIDYVIKSVRTDCDR